MLYIIITIGAAFFLWRFIKWKSKGFPVEIKKLFSLNFLINASGVIIAAALVVIYGKSNPAFSWPLIAIGVVGGFLISAIEAFSFGRADK